MRIHPNMDRWLQGGAVYQCADVKPYLWPLRLLDLFGSTAISHRIYGKLTMTKSGVLRRTLDVVFASEYFKKTMGYTWAGKVFHNFAPGRCFRLRAAGREKDLGSRKKLYNGFKREPGTDWGAFLERDIHNLPDL